MAVNYMTPSVNFGYGH